MKNMIDTLGNTPLVFLDEINGNKIFAKLEYYNPTGSVKDRPAYYMIKKALERGNIKEGATIIEPTSGNPPLSYFNIRNVTTSMSHSFLFMRIILWLFLSYCS